MVRSLKRIQQLNAIRAAQKYEFNRHKRIADASRVARRLEKYVQRADEEKQRVNVAINHILRRGKDVLSPEKRERLCELYDALEHIEEQVLEKREQYG